MDEITLQYREFCKDKPATQWRTVLDSDCTGGNHRDIQHAIGYLEAALADDAVSGKIRTYRMLFRNWAMEKMAEQLPQEADVHNADMSDMNEQSESKEDSDAPDKIDFAKLSDIHNKIATDATEYIDKHKEEIVRRILERMCEYASKQGGESENEHEIQ